MLFGNTGCYNPSLLNLKRISRLPVKDMYVLIQAIKQLNKKKNVSRVSQSSSEAKGGVSLSNGSKTTGSTDWKNWMTLQGKPNEVAVDVCDVGKSIGVKVNVACTNIFSVLSRWKSEGEKSGMVVKRIRGRR